MTTLYEGSLVQILGSDKIGIIASVSEKEKKAVVVFDKCEISMNFKNLKFPPPSTQLPKSRQHQKSTININIEKQHYSAHFQTEIDFHGFLVQEALDYLELFIEKALFANQKSITIIHGKGSGTLRTAIRQYLKKHKHIKITKAPINSYDDGMTHVDLI